jgi:hypothetical protein
MRQDVSHVPHILPWDFGMSRNNFFGHMRRSLADNLEVAHNCINGLGVRLEITAPEYFCSAHLASSIAVYIPCIKHSERCERLERFERWKRNVINATNATNANNVTNANSVGSVFHCQI